MLRLIYRMNERDYDRYFLQSTFTGRVQSAPKLLATSEGVRNFVSLVPGAIGYVRADALDDSVKAIRVDGRAPSDPDYALIVNAP